MIRLSAVGDVVRTLPALTCLRRAFPSAHIAWAVEEPSKDLLEDQPDLDETLIFPRRKLSRVFLHPSETGQARAALSAFMGSLKDAKFDLVIDFQATMKSAMMARLSGAPRRIGFGRKHGREMSHLLYSECVTLPRPAMSRVERALALVGHLGVDVTNATSVIPERPADASFAELFLATLTSPIHREESGRPTVVFPGTSWTQAYKRYPPEHFARTADLLAGTTGAPVVVAWGPGEEELAGDVITAMKTPATLAPPMTLGQLTSLIRRAGVFLAGDTGPMHIAWTVGTPVVAIYGPTDPALNQPGGEFSAIAYEKVFCSPCRNRGCIARTCLENLPPQKVADTALAVIRSAQTRRGGAPVQARVDGPPVRPRARYDVMGPGSGGGIGS